MTREEVNARVRARRKERRRTDPEFRKRNNAEAKAWRDANPDRVKELYKIWAAANPDRLRARDRKYLTARYGITPEDYDVMLAEQGGGCAICAVKNSGKRVLSIDHDHATGKVRGLLCSRCNSGIGLLADSPERLIAAAQYLQKSSVLH